VLLASLEEERNDDRRPVSPRATSSREIRRTAAWRWCTATDRRKKRIVAFKVLRPEYEGDAEFVRRFSREAEAAPMVSHEYIVYLLDVGMDGETTIYRHGVRDGESSRK
jgi:serine/threonine protein kinase